MALQSSAKLVAHSLIACLVISYVSVSLRLLARVKQKRALMATDWMMLAALASFTAYSGVTFAMAYNPMGVFVATLLPPSLLVPYIRASFATEIILGLTITLSKLSLLLFFRSIFITPSFKRLNTLVMGLTILWYMGTTIALFLQCNPRAAAWDATLLRGAACVPLGHIIAGYEASNILIDILIIALPVNSVLHLQISPARRIGIIFLFVLGGFVIVTSAIRIRCTNVTLKQFGQSITIVDESKTYLWTNIQSACTILCANLPCLPPLFPEAVKRRLSWMSTWVASLLSSIRSSRGTFKELPDDKTGAGQKYHVAAFDGSGSLPVQNHSHSTELHDFGDRNSSQV